MLEEKPKRISIPEPHFTFYYFILDRAPWVIKDGYNVNSLIPSGQFVPLMQKEGAQAMAVAASISQKKAKVIQSLPKQGELISRARS